MSARFDRRDFLEAAALAAGAAGVVPRWAFAASSDPRLKELARSIKGDVVSPSDSAYRSARILYNTRFDRVLPRAVVLPLSATDVAKTILWARKYGIPLAARVGGHSYGGYSTTTGVVVDLRRVNAVTVNGAGIATVGAGAALIDVYAGLARHGLTIPAGSCPTVGIAGLALGGGVGFTSRKLGLTCDNVRGLRIVTADGKVLTCDARHHPDLYWACRGGGGGNFGIVISLTFATHRVDTVSIYKLAWPWAQVRDVVAAWQSFAPHAPDELFSVLDLGATAQKVAGATPAVTSAGQFFGTPDELRALIQPLVGTGTPTRVTVRSLPFMNAVTMWGACAGPVSSCRLREKTPVGKLERETFKGKSDYVDAPLPAAGIETMVRAVESRQANADLGGGGILMDSSGGAINRVPKGATAFVHRDALFSCQYLAFWAAADPPRVAAANLAWIRAFYAAMRPYASGFAYQNYIDPDLKGWAHAYYGTNLPRLVRVKKAYDPGNVFRFAQSIPTRL